MNVRNPYFRDTNWECSHLALIENSIQECDLVGRHRQDRTEPVAAFRDHAFGPITSLPFCIRLCADNRNQFVFQFAVVVSHIVDCNSPPVFPVHRTVEHKAQP